MSGVTLAIIIGLIIGNIFNLKSVYDAGITFSAKTILALAIMLMGLKLEVSVLNELGIAAILIIILMVFITILAGFIIGKMFGLNKSFSVLLGVGNGICGSSAIAASAPVIGNNEEEIGLSISVVNLLGTIGIFTLPLIANILNFSETNSGLIIGSTLQATGQVVAAGFSINEFVGKISTIVKMGRILTLGPVVIILNLIFANNDSSIKDKISVPPFILGFLIFSIISSLKIIPNNIIFILKNTSSFLLIIVMAGIGLRIKISSLINQGPKALTVGVLIAFTQVSTAAFLIYLFF
jgi:uncharacterized integral membrane protein (TIGR00698 family)